MNITVAPGRAGTIQVGTRPPAPAGAGLVLLAGADAYVDPTAPDDPPYLLVTDLDEAAGAVAALFGADVVEAARALTTEPAASEVDAELGPAAADVRRIGLVRWLEACSPDELPQGLLDLEFGAAAARLDGLLGEIDDEEGEERLRRSAGTAVGLASRLRAGDPPPAGVAELVAAALPALHDVLPYSDPAFDDVRHEVELAAALRAFGPRDTVVDWDVLTALAAFASPDPITKGGNDSPTARLASVDWWQVPRGLLATGEDTVEWQLSADGSRVTVTVAARPGAALPDRRGAAALAFRLYAADLPLPIAIGELRPAADGARFTGSAPVHAPPNDPMTLDVHDAMAGRPPLIGPDRVAAQAARWAVRGVAALRLGRASAGEIAADGLGTAASLFREVGRVHPRPPARERAAAQAARCGALATAVLAGVLDLGGPGWQPLAAESALAAGTGWGR